ncbi:MAG: TAT-variant-translocated molybdopterin oxidoreductase [Candidatus Entotheonellia bacterium]
MNDAHQKTMPLDLAAIRARLETTQGSRYWRSLEELAETDEFREFLHREFPQQASEWHDAVSRRRFLQLMGASLALAGLSACTRQPEEKIVPYVRAPEDMIPGKPLFFATAIPLGGFAHGVVVESHEGRPTKIEGNPKHPASLGATHAFTQASVLTLYDPDRSQVVINVGRISTWGAFFAAVSLQLETQRLHKGQGLRILTETVTSPTLAHQLQALLNVFPEAKWHQYEPVNRDFIHAGARRAFGEHIATQYRFDQAQIILALDADFLSYGPASVRYAHDFAVKRRVREGQTAMNRLYAIETTPSMTGAMADHRLPMRAGEIAGIALIVAQELGIDAGESAAHLAPLRAAHRQWLNAVASDLQEHRGASIVIAGEQQPPIVHALAHAMNHALGNVGTTVFYTDPVEAIPVDQTASLQALVADIEAGLVDLLVIIGGNPVYNAPSELRLTEHLSKVKLRVHLGLYEDETAELCHWHLPETHVLEMWSDARAFDGTVTLIQPLIAPLYGGKSAHELLATLMGQPDRASYTIVRDYWRRQLPPEDFERFWRTALHEGLIANTALPYRTLEYRGLKIEAHDLPSAIVHPPSALELSLRPDPTIWDGRFANNGWLQELPKPLTKLTWDNAALISPATAQRLGLRNEHVVELRYQGRTLQAPVWIMPGHANDAVTVHLGYGRWRTGRVGRGTGVNAYVLRTSSAPWGDAGLELRNTGARYSLASTQHHHSMEGRPLVRVGTLAQYLAHPEFVHEMAHDPPPDLTLYPPYAYQGYAWGMAIDLNACIGCNACVVACQAENNIPIVGKNQVAVGREMHWLRIDRYYKGDMDNPATYHQPVLCMHCENAPCEVVCPVAATVHDDEGLNIMVYNRCVGTRYCSNNCPYKVRRFNFLQYVDDHTPVLKLLRNPDVTVRSRGVMEKCTYCVQRISAARIQAENEHRPIRDGEVITACQAACPSQAIVFGNINDLNSRVAKLKTTQLNYGLLTDLNTRPRTTYLARLSNPHPDLRQDEEHG